MVVLAGNDHKPLGPQEQLTVTIPKPLTAAGTRGGADDESVYRS